MFRELLDGQYPGKGMRDWSWASNNGVIFNQYWIENLKKQSRNQNYD